MEIDARVRHVEMMGIDAKEIRRINRGDELFLLDEE
jgi:hypothetical protein